VGRAPFGAEALVEGLKDAGDVLAVVPGTKARDRRPGYRSGARDGHRGEHPRHHLPGYGAPYALRRAELLGPRGEGGVGGVLRPLPEELPVGRARGAHGGVYRALPGRVGIGAAAGDGGGECDREETSGGRAAHRRGTGTVAPEGGADLTVVTLDAREALAYRCPSR
jgi:hypothetical protein